MNSSQPERNTRTIGGVGCYVDALRYQSRLYRGYSVNLLQGEDIQLGDVIFHVRKTLAAIGAHDPQSTLEFSDETATFLPAGTPVYEVTGYSADRRLAAYLNDTLHVYDARRR
jgi:hypothetical protein